ncbi:MAG: DUF2071 domain-containing protein [Acidobacteriota bacterium]|nr:DUF2071 domain-containing protein [Acidobacteriota bacterium]
MTKRFLTARWSYLAMLSYVVPPEILEPFVPKGTRLDLFEGKALISMVGFLFQETRLKGVPVPFHRHFEEVNLRFYVRREVDGEVRRGVVFIKEIVPRAALAMVARLVYNENYVAMPMEHELGLDGDVPVDPVVYRWRLNDEWNEMAVTPYGDPALPRPGSEQEFITEHYWGYAAQRDGGTVEYRVAHPTWEVWPVVDPVFRCDVAKLYGPEFVIPLDRQPDSAFLARGSEVEVFNGVRIA